MPWTKSRNPLSVDPADANADKNMIATNMLGLIWGVGTPASSKEWSSQHRGFLDYLRKVTTRQGVSGFVTKGLFSFSGGYPVGTFRAGLSEVYLKGLPVTEVGTGIADDTQSAYTMAAVPGTGSRTDLVYLEAFIVEVQGSTTSNPISTNKPDPTHVYKYGNVLYGGIGPADDINEVNFELCRRIQLQYRLRVVAGVNFTAYPKGVNDPVVLAQGPFGTPTSIPFAVDATDANVFVAGNGSAAHQTALGTLDGYVYAVPIAKVTRTAGSPGVLTGDVVDLRDTWGGVGSTTYIPLVQKAAVNGVATLGADGKVPGAQLPPITLAQVYTAATQAAQLALEPLNRGDIVIRTDTNITWIKNTTANTGTMADFTALPVATAAAIQSTPSGNLSSNNVQAALNELAEQIGGQGAQLTAAASVVLPDDYASFHITGPTAITGFAGRNAGQIVRLIWDSAGRLVHNATSMILQYGRDLNADLGDTITLICDGSNNYRELCRSTVQRAPTGLSGTSVLKIVRNATTTSVAAITANEVVLVNAFGRQQYHSAVSVSVNTATSGPAANGRDQSGEFASGALVYLWGISNGTTFAGLWSASATSPTLPAGYTYTVLLGAWKLNASTTVLFDLITNGRRTRRTASATRIIDVNAVVATVSGAAASFTGSYPAIATTVCYVAYNTSLDDYSWANGESFTIPIGSAAIGAAYGSGNVACTVHIIPVTGTVVFWGGYSAYAWTWDLMWWEIPGNLN